MEKAGRYKLYPSTAILLEGRVCRRCGGGRVSYHGIILDDGCACSGSDRRSVDQVLAEVAAPIIRDTVSERGLFPRDPHPRYSVEMFQHLWNMGIHCRMAFIEVPLQDIGYDLVDTSGFHENVAVCHFARPDGSRLVAIYDQREVEQG